MSNDHRWEAVLARDASQDGTFVFGVLTTGVYCRPSCPSRRARRENVRFYGSPAEAERDGLRACLRCRPADVAASPIPPLCRYIESHCDEAIPLERLAAEAGLSPWHLQRMFKAATGVTPRQYVEACRMERLKRDLRGGVPVTQAIFDNGYGSLSRVYEKTNQLGMTPRQYGRGGDRKLIRYAMVETPLGPLTVAATERGVCFVQFGDSAAALRDEFPEAAIEPMPKPYPDYIEDLRALAPPPGIPLDLRGTAFQMRVWRFLQTIPMGKTLSYSEVASGLGQPSAARAVASACARNTVALAIPCHRVVRGNGASGGYRWGEERKRALLERERSGSR